MGRNLIILAAVCVALAVAFLGYQAWQINRFAEAVDEGLNELAQATADNAAGADANAAQIAAELKETTVSTNFPDAPETVTEVANAIIDGAVPTPEQLAALGDDLDRSWSMPFPSDAPLFGHTLLRQAVLSRNFDAAQALVAAGANPRFNDDEIAFLAVTYHTDGWRVWFPDYRPGMAFLNLWLSSGGDPKARNIYYSSVGDILSSTPSNNLEALLALLAAGADPWAQYKPHDAAPDDDFVYASFFESLANANLQSAEVAFRIAQEGHFAGGPEKVVDEIVASYERVAAQYEDASGPRDQANAWGLKMAMAPIFEQMGRTPGDAVAAVLALDLPEDAGGFFLAEGEIRSPDDEDQRVNNDNQVGNETWHVR